MNIFRIPRKEVRVRVRFQDAQQVEGVFFAPTESPSGGPGLLSERLNDAAESFLPLDVGDQVQLLNKAKIALVEPVDATDEVESLDREELQRLAVRITIPGGDDVEGWLPYSMPAGKERLVDFLNESPEFFPVVAGSRVLLVNREQIVMVWGPDGTGGGADG